MYCGLISILCCLLTTANAQIVVIVPAPVPITVTVAPTSTPTASPTFTPTASPTNPTASPTNLYPDLSEITVDDIVIGYQTNAFTAVQLGMLSCCLCIVFFSSP
jgi:hypothetical protein